jgi:hypothetical protein
VIAESRTYVDQLIPALVPAGTSSGLEIRGRNFVPSTRVLWNGVARQAQYVDPTTLYTVVTLADVAPGAGATAQVGAITTYAAGQSSSDTEPLAINGGTNPVPTLSSLTPTSVNAGSAVILAVRGSGFVPGSVVRWNGGARATQFVSRNELRLTFASTDLTAPGTANVTVFNPAPGGGTSAALPFTIR